MRQALLALAVALAASSTARAVAPERADADIFWVVSAATAAVTGGPASLGGQTFTAQVVLKQPGAR